MNKAILGFTLGAVAGSAGAAEIFISGDITTSTTWTADNTYNLQDQVYVKNGATLTIEPGTRIASTPTANGSGSLAITRGSKIVARGRADAPIIFTSTNDDGTWREAANEWGNLTIMGNAYIGNSYVAGNVPTCDANNEANMEGLVPDFDGDPDTRYGGGDDDDCSGVLQYVSIRYGGRVVGLANELNGLSLGGVGRETLIDHVEIMNNVDDGIEIWGGTVELKHFSIWNIGDDSFDVDQGWRGKAQFGLIVQGYSLDASQGSGVGDNCFEVDGSEDSDSQPVTSAVIYNATVIGQPVDGDGGTAWRDNARVQYRNCIFMDIGERLVRFDNVDGDGANGYGFNGTTSWADTWTTDYDQYSTVNACSNPAVTYQAQTDGKLAEITDSVFFRNQASDAYTEADARGVRSSGKNNVTIAGFADADSPITTLTRTGPVTRGGKLMLPVATIDPRPANEALSSVATAPDDGFFDQADYRGAFSPDENWLCGWSAADEFGFLITPAGACPTPCNSDVNGNGAVDFNDIVDLLAAWGPCGDCGSCATDIDGTGEVDFNDLVSLLAAYGDCP